MQIKTRAKFFFLFVLVSHGFEKKVSINWCIGVSKEKVMYCTHYVKYIFYKYHKLLINSVYNITFCMNMH